MGLASRLLGRLHRVFNQDPAAFRAIVFTYAGASLTWQVDDDTLTLTAASGVILQADLSTLTVSQLAAQIAALPQFSAVMHDQAAADLSARLLVEGEGDASPGVLLGYTSLLHALMGAFAGPLRDLRADIAVGVSEVDVRFSEDVNLDLYGALYGVLRASGETDASYRPRVIGAVFLSRGNNVVIAQAVQQATGGTNVRVVDTTIDQPPLFYNGDYVYAGARPPAGVRHNLFKVTGTFPAGMTAQQVDAAVRKVVNDYRDAGTHLTQVPTANAPNALVFNDAGPVAPNTNAYSNTVTLSGLAGQASASITGGWYSLNGGPYVFGFSYVNNGDTVRLRSLSSDTGNTQHAVTFTVGTYSATWNVSTGQPQDTTPDSFAFQPQSGVATSSPITSNAVSVSGINAPASITVTGGSYSINGGAFTSAAGTVSNGDSVRAQVQSSASASTATSSTITIGGVSATFSVTTAAAPAADTTPDAFSFTPKTGVPASTQIDSDPVTITGINSQAVISVSNGLYSINGSDTFINNPGYVNNGDQVTAELLSSADAGVSTSMTITVGGVSATFTVTTGEGTDSEPDPFTFGHRTGAPVNSTVFSGVVTVTGFTGSLPISLDNGEGYSQNGGPYTIDGGYAVSGDTFKLKTDTSEYPQDTTTVTLTIGTVSGTWIVTNRNRQAGDPVRP